MWAEQAIFTSLSRDGRAGYHVVAQSKGLSEADAGALATWCPTHGSLIVDSWNRTSVNFHPMPGGRHALARTCAGPAEYSGRGGSQLYTHALVVDAAALRQAHDRPLALYRDALALGYLHYREEPPSSLSPVELSSPPPRVDAAKWEARARDLGLPPVESLRAQLSAGESLQLVHRGDRIALCECLLGLLAGASAPLVSFSTSLQPSVVRPFQVTLT